MILRAHRLGQWEWRVVRARFGFHAYVWNSGELERQIWALTFMGAARKAGRYVRNQSFG